MRMVIIIVNVYESKKELEFIELIISVNCSTQDKYCAQ